MYLHSRWHGHDIDSTGRGLSDFLLITAALLPDKRQLAQKLAVSEWTGWHQLVSARISHDWFV